MNIPALMTLSVPMILLVAACDVGNPVVNETDEPSATPSMAPAGSSTGQISADAPAPASGTLSKYVGKHPSDLVDGKRFLDEPAVKAAVAATVADAKVRDFVFNYNGPDAPIVSKGGRILAWGCERHNCGYHNWSVSITPEGSSADVCFYDNDDSADGPATWHLASGRTEKRAGNCPSD